MATIVTGVTRVYWLDRHKNTVIKDSEQVLLLLLLVRMEFGSIMSMFPKPGVINRTEIWVIDP